jgi:hypothetical protein
MRRVFLLVATFVIAHGCVALAAEKIRVAVFFDGAFIKSGETVWQGDVFGPKACAKRRRVYIFRVRSGKDAKIGSTRSRKATGTPNFYPFSYSEPGVAKAGKYYAKVKPTETCAGNRSATYSGPA